jgi:hypothetical protein
VKKPARKIKRYAEGGGVDPLVEQKGDDLRPAMGRFGPMAGTSGPINLAAQKAEQRQARDDAAAAQATGKAKGGKVKKVVRKRR